MPFNDKGEFLRTNDETQPLTKRSWPLWSVENLCLLFMGIGALVLLAATIWLLVHYWEIFVCGCIALIALKLVRRPR